MYQMIRKLGRRFIRFWRPDRIDLSFASLSYSQEGEDRVLARLLGDTAEPGFYVDIGAFHPMCYSNTCAFYKRGWRGINIDARPGGMELFNRLRPRDVNLELAISDESQTLTYYQFNEPAFNGFCKEHALRWDGVAQYKIVGTTEIGALPLAEVLAKYLPVGQSIDFLNVDVEGLDEKVLRSNDWHVRFGGRPRDEVIARRS
jgi:FkbM family methyltransferase